MAKLLKLLPSPHEASAQASADIFNTIRKAERSTPRPGKYFGRGKVQVRGSKAKLPGAKAKLPGDKAKRPGDNLERLSLRPGKDLGGGRVKVKVELEEGGEVQHLDIELPSLVRSLVGQPKPSHTFNAGAGILLKDLSERSLPVSVRDGAARYIVFDRDVSKRNLSGVIEFVKELRGKWREKGHAPRCYVMVEVTAVDRSLHGRMAEVGIIMLGNVTGASPRERARELEKRLVPVAPASTVARWPRPQGKPRVLTEHEQEVVDEIVAASQLDGDRSVD
jgi:hypothetical protein